mgnify:CR=1 FL=1
MNVQSVFFCLSLIGIVLLQAEAFYSGPINMNESETALSGIHNTISHQDNVLGDKSNKGLTSSVTSLIMTKPCVLYQMDIMYQDPITLRRYGDHSWRCEMEHEYTVRAYE